jgi:hypothetical protein
VRIFPRAGFAAQMVGGEIQGSNQSATAGFMTLAKIDKAPREGEWTRIALNNTKPYRFLRYFGPAGSYSTVAEIEFLSGDKKIVGTLMAPSARAIIRATISTKLSMAILTPSSMRSRQPRSI